MSLNSYVDKKVAVLTVEGRYMVGILQAYDSSTNLVLKDTIERVIFPADDERQSFLEPHGIYLVRGELVVLVGQVDEELDDSIDWTQVKGNAIGTTKHTG